MNVSLDLSPAQLSKLRKFQRCAYYTSYGWAQKAFTEPCGLAGQILTNATRRHRLLSELTKAININKNAEKMNASKSSSSCDSSDANGIS